YLKERVCAVGENYFGNPSVLPDILRYCDAVISGSMALHILLPQNGTAWTPRDLDIYMAQTSSAYLLKKLFREGFTSASEVDLNEMGYRHCNLSHVVVLTRDHLRIDILVSSTSAAISPILQFHSTAVMNFISVDTIFSCYPFLTLQHLSIMNVGLLYHSMSKHSLIDAVMKYQRHGFTYVRCKDVHEPGNMCKVMTRTITDGAMMWMNMVAIPEGTHTGLEVFQQFGVLDLQWMLGGMPCGLERAFCHPRVEVIEDEW
ncbi:hypothetical protein EDD15DRAFT_2152953, partial [Pisolithus albus]